MCIIFALCALKLKKSNGNEYWCRRSVCLLKSNAVSRLLFNKSSIWLHYILSLQSIDKVMKKNFI